jgi:hypothetical protein
MKSIILLVNSSKWVVVLFAFMITGTFSVNILQAQNFGTVDISNNGVRLGHQNGTIFMRRCGNGDYTWKRALVVHSDRLTVNYDGDFTNGVEIQSALRVKGTLRAPEIQVLTADISTLKVNGDMHANNIHIATNGQTADFVFESDYNLRSLNELESIIIENKHLPEIPSATDMENNGVDLAEINKLLLMKIEELTI